MDKSVGLFHADSGFCSETIFSFLERRAAVLPYVIAGCMHALIQQKTKDIKAWNVVDKEIWIVEFSHRAKVWGRDSRCMVVKQFTRLWEKVKAF